MRISDWSSDVCSSDLRRRDQPAISFARIRRGPKRQEADTHRLPRPDRWTVEPLENGDKEADSAGERQPPKPPRPIPILSAAHPAPPLHLAVNRPSARLGKRKSTETANELRHSHHLRRPDRKSVVSGKSGTP